MSEKELSIALGFRPHGGLAPTLTASRATQSLHDVLQRCMPTGDRRESSGLGVSDVAALAFEREHVLPEIVGQLDDV